MIQPMVRSWDLPRDISGDFSAAPPNWWDGLQREIAYFLPPSWLLSTVGAIVAVFLVRPTLRGLARLFRTYVAPRPIEDALTIVAATIATGVSATGMWRFAEDVLHLPFALRVLLFAFIEVAIITSAVRARRNMRENFSAGIDGIAVWALTVLTAVLSSMDARSLPEAVFRLAAPLVAAWLWERGMAIERHRIRGTGRINWRLTPERVMVRLGLAEATDRTAGEVDIQRRLTRIGLAAKRARDLRAAGASDRKQRAAMARLDKAFEAAAEHTGLGRDKAMQERVRAEVAALYSATSLIDVIAESEWMRPVEEPFSRLATETERLNAILADRHEAKSTIANLAMLAADATGHRLIPSTNRQVDNAVDATVDGRVDEQFVPASPAAPSSTPPSTSLVTVERVDGRVDFDVTDPTVFDLERLWSSTPPSTGLSTLPSTGSEVDDDVDEDGSKTQAMRAFWDQEVAKKNYPKPIELARHAGASRSLAARLREKWVEELKGWAKRRAIAALRDKAST